MTETLAHSSPSSSLQEAVSGDLASIVAGTASSASHARSTSVRGENDVSAEAHHVHAPHAPHCEVEVGRRVGRK